MPRIGRIANGAIAAILVLSAAVAGAQSASLPPRQMENLGRGVVASNQGGGKVFVSWRILGTDPDAIAFNLYRQSGSAAPVKVNAAPLDKGSNYQDSGVSLDEAVSYTVRPVVNGKEMEASKPFKLPAKAPVGQSIKLPLHYLEGFQPNDCSAGDLDGDGEYEIVVHQVSRGQDNSRPGVTGTPVLQAYKLDGTMMWQINLGINVRDGAHYTQFMVYDLDGDGRAEVVCKTADGTWDGTGKAIGDKNADWRGKPEEFNSWLGRRRGGGRGGRGGAQAAGNRGAAPGAPAAAAPTSATALVATQVSTATLNGFVLKGPEFLTVFDGRTGAAIDSQTYLPQRFPGTDNPTAQQLYDTWGDASGNREDRFLAAVAYLDGVHPSVVFCRGYYSRTVLAAWDLKDGKLVNRWVFDSNDGNPENLKYRGQGNHNLSVADVDGDGKDEIVYGACVIDDDGKGLYSTGLGHGDAQHVSDLDPARPGLEIAAIHENESGQEKWGTTFRNAKTGEIYFKGDWTLDVGRGLAADVDPRYPGAEYFSGNEGSKDVNGKSIPVRGGSNFVIWWDGDPLRELLNDNAITKWNWKTNRMDTIFVAEGCWSTNGTKSTPALSADLFGDWREELIEAADDFQSLRIFTTTIPTDIRMPTLMHDSQYRVAIAWQNVAYNQPPWPSFFIGDGMKTPPKANIMLVGAKAGQ